MYYDFFNIAVFLLAGVGLVYAGLLVLGLFRPDKPSDLKLSTYECGEEAFGSSWVRFDMRFYTVALIFVVFDLEIAFLFPWAKVFKDVGTIAVVEGLIFVLILFLGLVYVWAKGDLDWVKAFSQGHIVGADHPRVRLIGQRADTAGREQDTEQAAGAAADSEGEPAAVGAAEASDTDEGSSEKSGE